MTLSLRMRCAQALLTTGLLCSATVAFAQAQDEGADATADTSAEATADTSADTSADAADDAEVMETTSAPAVDPGPPIAAIPAFGDAPSIGSGSTANSSNSFHADMDLKFRVQPLGLVLGTRLYNEYEYMKNNVGLLFSHVFFRAGAAVNLSPAYAEIGPEIEFQPIRVFSLRAAYLGAYNFGTFKYILGYDNPNPVTRDDELDLIADQAQSGMSHRLEIQPTFQVALGKIAMRNTFTYQRLWYPGESFAGPWLRESSYDRIIHNDGDAILANLLILMYQVADPDGPAGDGTAYVGAFHEWARGVGAQDNRHRVGLMGLYVPAHRWGKVYRPRLILQAGYNVVDRDNGRDNRFFLQGQLGFTLHGRR